MSEKPLSTAWNAVPLGRVASPLRTQVFNVIRQAILNLDLKPGQRLVERELVEQLNVSRTTIREVLALLVSEGLVTVIPQQGAIVSVLSDDEAADIYGMRSALERFAVEWFVERASPEQVRDLRVALETYVETTDDEENKLAELKAKDNFYAVLLEGANSPPLTQILTALHGRVRVLRAMSLSVPGRARESALELTRVVELIEAGDAVGAGEACAEHVRNASKTGLDRLAVDREGEVAPLSGA